MTFRRARWPSWTPTRRNNIGSRLGCASIGGLVSSPLASREHQARAVHHHHEGAAATIGRAPFVVYANTAYIVSANISRRHLTKGQRAMAMAKLYPEPEKLRRKGSGSVKNTEQVSGEYISHARTVLHWLPVVADQVPAFCAAIICPTRLLTLP